MRVVTTAEVTAMPVTEAEPITARVKFALGEASPVMVALVIVAELALKVGMNALVTVAPVILADP